MDSQTRVCPFDKCTAIIKSSLATYNFCSKHICCFRDCQNSVAKISQAEACYEHTCSYPGCVASVQHNVNSDKFGRACARHTCMHESCDNTVLEERQFCEQHSCKRGDCRLPTCQDFRTLCTVHMCAQPGCTNACDLAHGLFCSTHCCVRCPNRRLEGSVGCPRHTCIFSGCTELSMDNGTIQGSGVCSSHQCSRCSVTALIVSEEHKLCQKHMCNHFKCTLPARDNLVYCAEHSCTYYDDSREKQCQREGSGEPLLCVHHMCTYPKCKNAREPHNNLCSPCILASSVVEKDKVPEEKPSPQVMPQTVEKRTPRTFESKKDRVTLRQRPYCLRSRATKA